MCYGDSNTRGFDPEAGERFAPVVRWPGVLAREGGEGFRVVEEGLSARTTVRDGSIDGAYKNGRAYLRAGMESHKPVDLVALMLGTNDLKQRFAASASNVEQGGAVLAGAVLRSGCGPGSRAQPVILMAPPPVGKLPEMFEGSAEKAVRFVGQYGCGFLDVGAVAASGDLDGIHLEAEEHCKLGEAVAASVAEFLR